MKLENDVGKELRRKNQRFTEAVIDAFRTTNLLWVQFFCCHHPGTTKNLDGSSCGRRTCFWLDKLFFHTRSIDFILRSSATYFSRWQPDLWKLDLFSVCLAIIAVYLQTEFSVFISFFDKFCSFVKTRVFHLKVSLGWFLLCRTSAVEGFFKFATIKGKSFIESCW